MTNTAEYKQGYEDGYFDGKFEASNEYWKEFRANAAKDILCALIARTSMFSGENIQHGVNVALEYADVLIKQLREDEK